MRESRADSRPITWHARCWPPRRGESSGFLSGRSRQQGTHGKGTPMSLRVPALTCAFLLVVFLGRSASAQPAIQKMEESFGRIEAGLNDVEQRKVITRTFDLWTALHSYDQATYDAYNSVTQAVKASPNPATVAQLTQFEDKIQN